MTRTRATAIGIMTGILLLALVATSGTAAADHLGRTCSGNVDTLCWDPCSPGHCPFAVLCTVYVNLRLGIAGVNCLHL